MMDCHKHGVRMYLSSRRHGVLTCPVCEHEDDLQRQSDEQSSLLHEQVELAKQRRREEAVCGLCGQRFVAETTKREEPGEEWRGIIARFGREGVCPRCYFERIDKGEVTEWNRTQWEAHRGSEVSSLKTSQDAKRLVEALEREGFAELAQRTRNMRADLEDEEQRAAAEESRKKLSDLETRVRGAVTSKDVARVLADAPNGEGLWPDFWREATTKLSQLEAAEKSEREVRERRETAERAEREKRAVAERTERERREVLAKMDAIANECAAREHDEAAANVGRALKGAIGPAIAGAALGAVVAVGLFRDHVAYAALIGGVFGGISSYGSSSRSS